MGASTSPSETTPSPGGSEDPSPSLSTSPEPSPSPEPEPEPLGPSRAHLSVTGDIGTNVDLPLAAVDSFSVTWCDAPKDCANAANSLQVMGERLGVRGSHETPHGLTVTLEVQDRFLYVSGDQYTQGECTVSFTVADERGFAGKIACANITNGSSLGILTISVRGTFVAAF